MSDEKRFITLGSSPHKGVLYPFVFCLPDKRTSMGNINTLAGAIGWCHDQFGPSTGSNWSYGEAHFYFMTKDDAFAFRMRWC